jgi:glycosyltransferase involved in cell wall biosynthesis
MQPLVTIITPVYNGEKYIRETIESVLSQDYPNLEYLILDDGSSDNTPNILAEYSKRIIHYSHSNIGETRTVNKGFSLAKGDLIIIVNSDDFLLPGAIRAGVDVLRDHPEAVVAYPNWVYIDADSRPFCEMKVPDYDYVYMVKRHHCLVQSGALIRRSGLEMCGFRDEQFKYVGDFELWLRLGLYGTFIHIPVTYGTFRVHSDSTSVKFKSLMAQEDIRLITKYYSIPNLPPEIQVVKREAFSRAFFHAAQNCEPNHHLAFPYYKESFLFYPKTFFDPKVIIRLIDIYLLTLLPNKFVKILKREIKQIVRLIGNANSNYGGNR